MMVMISARASKAFDNVDPRYWAKELIVMISARASKAFDQRSEWLIEGDRQGDDLCEGEQGLRHRISFGCVQRGQVMISARASKAFGAVVRQDVVGLTEVMISARASKAFDDLTCAEGRSPPEVMISARASKAFDQSSHPSRSRRSLRGRARLSTRSSRRKVLDVTSTADPF
jgi:hypothetical protein